jgi:DNA polymerase-3 subunit delta'
LHGSARFNPDFSAALQKLGLRADLGKLLALAKVQANEGRILTHPLNRSLQLQAWLIQYRHMFD